MSYDPAWNYARGPIGCPETDGERCDARDCTRRQACAADDPEPADADWDIAQITPDGYAR